MGDMRVGSSSSFSTPKLQKSQGSSNVFSSSQTHSVKESSPVTKTLGPRPNYPCPQPPQKAPDLSNPASRAQELSSISSPQSRPRSGAQMSKLQDSKPSKEVQNASNLIGVMQDPKFAQTLERFSPSMGQRFLQACGKSEGSVDGGRFQKNALKMVPLVNIGVYGKDAVRAQKTKNALNGIAEHAGANGNQLAQQLAQSLGAHEKSKRNTQIIGGAVAVVSTAAAFVPGTQAAPALAGASSSLASGIGAKVAGVGVQYTAAAAIDSGIRNLGGTALYTGASTLQDAAITGNSRNGELVGKEKIGSGYSKLKVSARMDEGQVKLETEMGYQAARALVNYLGPAQGMTESPASPRMMLRRSLGATDDDKSYSISENKLANRADAAKIDVNDGRTDYLQMFFDIGVKGADMRLAG